MESRIGIRCSPSLNLDRKLCHRSLNLPFALLKAEFGTPCVVRELFALHPFANLHLRTKPDTPFLRSWSIGSILKPCCGKFTTYHL